MPQDVFEPLVARIQQVRPCYSVGKVVEVSTNALQVVGLNRVAALGDVIDLGDGLSGEVVRVDPAGCLVMAEGTTAGLRLGAPARHLGPRLIAPGRHWIGRVIDPDGRPIDGRPLFPGTTARALHAPPPSPTARRGLGRRLDTGLAVFDTVLPLAQGQRIGLFAGSGVGKSRLLSRLALGVGADVVVIGMIGERGREVRDFLEDTLGAEGLARSVVVAATSDRSALTRARAAHTMMTVAEYFRDQGAHVLMLADSITRFAEAQREVAAATGEASSLRGFPPSMAQQIMSLCERAGPGAEGQGDITAILSVLVAGSDMEEPVADVMRGVLDGHVVLDRKIAERGRYPAVSLLRSVSRSLPGVATEEENRLIALVRRYLGAYDKTELMLQAGLYAEGHDPVTDTAVRLWPALDAFLASDSPGGATEAFAMLQSILEPEVSPAG
ncbi:FliI/YscN family ATPase [Rhodophyticola porphyridii]|uniref:FliI/YscN family ATPase n=1 Tax=Rhodophyticola porphyridii TaxID=1852017 RepID=A0A3L9Y3W5_9RHOB|nr:FliI/YscN family ATPase [Rhodophyticola porphyridii]RMA43494.1 FliI/YscN family ATPase [Rhodophyticola porphyridii]